MFTGGCLFSSPKNWGISKSSNHLSHFFHCRAFADTRLDGQERKCASRSAKSFDTRPRTARIRSCRSSMSTNAHTTVNVFFMPTFYHNSVSASLPDWIGRKLSSFAKTTPTASLLLMERFVLAMDQIAFGHGAFLILHGAFSHRLWNIRPFNRLVLEMYRLVFQIDRRVSAPERPATGVMKRRPFVHTGEVKRRYWAECQSQQGKAITAQNGFWPRMRFVQL